jgi:hypothetical protein
MARGRMSMHSLGLDAISERPIRKPLKKISYMGRRFRGFCRRMHHRSIKNIIHSQGRGVNSFSLLQGPQKAEMFPRRT